MEEKRPSKAAAPKKMKTPAEQKPIKKETAPGGAKEEKKKGSKTAKGEETPGQQIEALQKALEEKTNEAASHYEQLLRVRAESENFKKRQAKEHSQFLKYSNENLIKSLFPVINNLDRANEAAKTNKDVESLRVGVEMILKMFYEALKKAGVEPVESIGQAFDPSRHEVISCMESANHEENVVMQEFEKGYYLHDRLLCPAKVVISKKLADSEQEKSEP